MARHMQMPASIGPETHPHIENEGNCDSSFHDKPRWGRENGFFRNGSAMLQIGLILTYVKESCQREPCKAQISPERVLWALIPLGSSEDNHIVSQHRTDYIRALSSPPLPLYTTFALWFWPFRATIQLCNILLTDSEMATWFVLAHRKNQNRP